MIFGWIIHALIGFISAAPFQHIPGDVLIGCMAALIPDIDIKTSLLGRFNPFARWMVHRGFCHSITFALILSIPFLAVGNLTFLIGILSHILADWLSSWGRWHIKLY